MKPVAVLLIAATAAAPAFAAASLADAEQLRRILTDKPPCCVIDGRSAAARAVKPLPGAIFWRRGIRVDPGGTVIVIGNDDPGAEALAKRIAKAGRAAQVLAVKGGYAAWQAVSGDEATGRSFVIPRNTCEQGKPLQTLRAAPGRP